MKHDCVLNKQYYSHACKWWKHALRTSAGWRHWVKYISQMTDTLVAAFRLVDAWRMTWTIKRIVRTLVHICMDNISKSGFCSSNGTAADELYCPWALASQELLAQELLLITLLLDCTSNAKICITCCMYKQSQTRQTILIRKSHWSVCLLHTIKLTLIYFSKR